jgi:hypothetical protein
MSRNRFRTLSSALNRRRSSSRVAGTRASGESVLSGVAGGSTRAETQTRLVLILGLEPEPELLEVARRPVPDCCPWCVSR